MAHFFEPYGLQKDMFYDIGWFAPNSISKAWVTIGISFDIALWGGSDLAYRAEQLDMVPSAQLGIYLEELPQAGDIRNFRCKCNSAGHYLIQTYTKGPDHRKSVWLKVDVEIESVTRVQSARFRALRASWIAYRADVQPVTAQFNQLRKDLYEARNAGVGKNRPISAWPAHLIDPDDGVMAAVEHYFLCRAWVGNGTYPASEVMVMQDIYNVGKIFGVTPKHNPNKPTTPLSWLQVQAQTNGVRDGEADLKASGKPEPGIQPPPKYW